jgi:diguanylate cyclase (GGDEF)-like protein
MFRRTLRALDRGSSFLIMLLSLVLVVAVGALDMATGYELSLAILYVIPIAVASWYVGERAGVAIAVASGVAWVAANFWAGEAAASTFVRGWNGVVRMAIFLVIGVALARLRAERRNTRKLLDEDWLTGFLNGRAFLDELSRATENSGRRPLTVSRVDADNLDYVNERFGRVAGDELIAALATAMKASLPVDAAIGRLSGGHFAVLLSGPSPDNARETMSKLQTRMAEAVARLDRPVDVAIAGVTWCRRPGSADEAMRRIDRLMTRLDQVPERQREALLFESEECD